jgi:uncharacterized repeat protein (TIGR04138 family)
MEALSFEEGVDLIVEKDDRYPREAYLFLREALEHTQKGVSKTSADQEHHVTGQELLEGIREYALQQFGPMVLTVFEEWRIAKCEDFGDLVFNLVENSLLKKTESDSRNDFQGGYDFFTAFRKPFLPSRRARPGIPAGLSAT